MDILDIFFDILLKPPQPLMGLFFTNNGKLKGEFSDKLWCDFGGNFRDQFQHKPARETPSRLAIPNFSKKSRCGWVINKQTL